MTSSPAAMEDANAIVCASPSPRRQWFECSAWGLAPQQTPRENTAIRTWCTQHQLQYVIVYGNQLKDWTPNTVLHTKYCIVHAHDSHTLEILMVYRPLLFHLNNAHVVCLRENTRYILQDCHTVNIHRLRSPHSPFTTNVLGLCEEPGMVVWAAATTTENLYIVVLQDEMSGHLYCAAKGCRKTFVSLDDWKAHYSTHFLLPPHFYRASVHNGELRFVQGEKLQCGIRQPHSRDYIADRLHRHSWAWRSLGDTIYGKHMHSQLYRKLQTVQHERCFIEN